MSASSNNSASAPSGQSLPPGTRLKEFVVERVLGSGGFGITYLARDERLGRTVVIKENLPVQFAYRDPSSLTVSPRHSDGEDAESFAWSLENFEKEAAMLASLRHEGIVPILRSFEAFGTAYFVMPFVEGMALDERIRERHGAGATFTDAEIRRILNRILEALGYLHARGIYHRDIKPGNILLTDEGTPVLIDFGAARQRLGERSLTVIESPGYTPFEQLQSQGKIGPWSDLYALGATIYKAITGETPAKAADRAFADPVEALAGREELSGLYSAGLLTGVDRALAVKPEDRWSGPGEWLGSLERPSSGELANLAESAPKPRPVPRAASRRAGPLNSKKIQQFATWRYAVVAVLVVAVGLAWLLRKELSDKFVLAGNGASTAAIASDSPTLTVDERRQEAINGGRSGESVIGSPGLDPIEERPTNFTGLNMPAIPVDPDTVIPTGEESTAVPAAEATSPLTALEPQSAEATAPVGSSSNYDPPESFPVPGKEDDSRLGKTPDLIDAFLRAPDWERRLNYAYQGESLRAAVEDYYRKWPYQPFARYSQRLYQIETDDNGTTYWVFLVSTSDNEDGFPLIVRTENDTIKIDWEIFAEFADRHYLRFREGKVAPPATFRLILERFSDYYGSDREAFAELDQYLVFQVNPPYGDFNEFSETVFVKKDSPVAKKIEPILKLGDDPLAVIVTLDRQAFAHGVRHYVITDFVAEGWFR